MKAVLLGGTDITLAVGAAMLDAGCDLAVVTVPEELSISFSQGPLRLARHADVGDWATDLGLPVHRYTSMGDLHAFVAETHADIAVAAGWYHMIPAALRESFPLGCLGLHASLLPALRGHAPLKWAILTGAAETGVTLFELGDSIDDGPIYGQTRIPIGPRTTIGDLVVSAREAGATVVRTALLGIADGTVRPQPQQGTSSYCLSRIPDDGSIDWREPVEHVDRLIRAVGRPYPGAFSYLDGAKLTIWAGEPAEGVAAVHGAPGQLFRPPGVDDPCVVCGDGLLRIVEATGPDGDDAIPLLRKRTYWRLTAHG